MNKNNNRLMLHTGATFFREMSGVQYIPVYQRISINFFCASQFLLLIIKCKRKTIPRPTYPTILIFRLQLALFLYSRSVVAMYRYLVVTIYSTFDKARDICVYTGTLGTRVQYEVTRYARYSPPAVVVVI